MLVDSHCHIDFEPYVNQGLFKDYDPNFHTLPLFLKRAVKSGVTHLLAIGTSLSDSLKNLRYKTDDNIKIFSAVGIHPDNAKSHCEMYGLDSSINELEKMSEKAVCIGECGLDYRNGEGDKRFQIDMFEAQIELSEKVGLPLEIHSRMAEEDTIAVLKNHKKANGVIHCFSGSADFANKALDLGFSISFSGVVTFKNAIEIQEIASKLVPENMILVETDSPFLSPVPLRGKINEPANVVEIAKFIANIRGKTFSEICDITTNNFFNVFRRCSR